MKTISQQLPDEFNVKMYGRNLSMRQVVYPDDMPLLHKWMHAEHVVGQWQLNLPMPTLKLHFEKAIKDDHQRLYIFYCEDTPLGYVEIYEAYRDRLSLYYDAKETDMGWHWLIGELHATKRGLLKPIGAMFSEFIFQHTEAEKIVGEPEISLSRGPYESVTGDSGYQRQCIIEFPEKTAELYYCYRNDFYESKMLKEIYESDKVLEL